MNLINLFILFSMFNLYDSHIFMKFPPSRRNKYSQYYVNSGQVNYDLASPLYDGLTSPLFTFPCKSFKKGPWTTEVVGNKVRIELEGSVKHNGGHCQFGITYDDNTFIVLKTIMKTCLLDTMTYEFDLPVNTPSGETTIFWTWINAIGRREYYMECADILLSNSNSNKNVNLIGLELVVVNIPGKVTIPEFINGGNDGSNLFNLRQQITLNPSSLNSPPISSLNSQPTSSLNSPPTSSLNSPPTSSIISSSSLPIQTSNNCITGNMLCFEDGFVTCSYNKWLKQSCAPGTKCSQLNENVISCV